MQQLLVAGRYRLVVRPQSGTPNDRYTVRVHIGKQVKTYRFAASAGTTVINVPAA